MKMRRGAWTGLMWKAVWVVRPVGTLCETGTAGQVPTVPDEDITIASGGISSKSRKLQTYFHSICSDAMCKALSSYRIAS